MGCWNALGGKIEEGETALQGAIRETFEEANIKLDDMTFCGSFTWENIADEDDKGNIACFYAFVKEKTPTPFKFHEGILDWKKIDWILNSKNLGVATDLPPFITHMFKDEVLKYHCVYNVTKLIEFKILK